MINSTSSINQSTNNPFLFNLKSTNVGSNQYAPINSPEESGLQSVSSLSKTNNTQPVSDPYAGMSTEDKMNIVLENQELLAFASSLFGNNGTEATTTPAATQMENEETKGLDKDILAYGITKPDGISSTTPAGVQMRGEGTGECSPMFGPEGAHDRLTDSVVGSKFDSYKLFA